MLLAWLVCGRAELGWAGRLAAGLMAQQGYSSRKVVGHS